MQKPRMTSRERVLAAARGLPVDQVPVMYWLNPHMACQLIAEHAPADSFKANLIARILWKRFRKHGEMDAGEWTRALPNLLIGYGNGPYLARLGSDLAFASIGSAKRLDKMFHMLSREDGHLRVRDPLGCVRAVGGIYLEVIDAPIKDVDDLIGYEMPDISDTTDIRELRKAYPEVCILAEVSGIQQVLCDVLWGTSQYMLALYDHPGEIKRFNQRLADWSIAQVKAAVQAGADVVFIGDDYGTTGRPSISMDMWLEFTYPYLRRIIDAVHEMGALAMLHSCGYQMSFLEYYVTAGLDILQSFQPNAGNDFAVAY